MLPEPPIGCDNYGILKIDTKQLRKGEVITVVISEYGNSISSNLSKPIDFREFLSDEELKGKIDVTDKIQKAIKEQQSSEISDIGIEVKDELGLQTVYLNPGCHVTLEVGEKMKVVARRLPEPVFKHPKEYDEYVPTHAELAAKTEQPVECRAAFEKWGNLLRFGWQFTRGVNEEIYDNPETHEYWRVWQAAWDARELMREVSFDADIFKTKLREIINQSISGLYPEDNRDRMHYTRQLAQEMLNHIEDEKSSNQ